MIPSRAAPILAGRLAVRAATTGQDLSRALALRGQVFRGGAADGDRFDRDCLHVLVEDQSASGPGDGQAPQLLACFRLLPMASGAEIEKSYSAQSYDLSAWSGYGLPILELGRFCMAPDCADPNALRLAWAFITREVDARGAGMLCGCTSFPGTDPAPHRTAFAALRNHLGPAELAPKPLARGTLPFPDVTSAADPRAALAGMPPLLRTYLAMGGWVSDHAVPDPDLNTLHVFTAVEIAAIPASRARALRMLAQ